MSVFRRQVDRFVGSRGDGAIDAHARRNVGRIAIASPGIGSDPAVRIESIATRHAIPFVGSEADSTPVFLAIDLESNCNRPAAGL
jgi:hypothetical protein